MNPKAHLFICVHSRENDEAHCSGRGSQELRNEVKKLCQEKNLPKGTWRVNNSGCLGRCSEGIATVLYPKSEWHLHVQPSQAQMLADLVEKAVKGN